MIRHLVFLLFVLTSLLPASARKKNATPPPSSPSSSTTAKGLFDVTRQETQQGVDWFFLVPDSLLNREILVTVRYASTPVNIKKYGGEQVNQQTLYFQKGQDSKLLLRSHLLLTAADTTDAINRAVRISAEDPIIATFKIESKVGKASKIKVTSLFLEDNPALGLSSYAKRSLGLQAPVSGSSFIESIKTFPLNTEVRTLRTWTASGTGSYAAEQTGKVTLGLNISFVLLPKTPMPRRLFDPRVGYFADNFTLYSDHQQQVQQKKFITRWRLEPKDSADTEKMKRGELVEPKKPIVYYIDPATPQQWRPYLIKGVEDWQKAFEKAGFKNAIQAREWPENDSTMSMEDARYSCIRYLASDIENAYGPNVHDPRSGEIIESHICWYHNVMSLLHDWYMVQAGSLDEAAQKMRYDTELMGQLIRFVSSHEVGHTLGLRHNFGSSSTVPVDSLRSRDFVVKNGHTPSIMDYARFNYVAQPEDSIPTEGIFPRIGDYDCWAIQWGYTPMWNAYDDVSDHYELEKLTAFVLPGNRRLWFGDGETNQTNDARCQTEDLGDDAVKASDYGILNLKRQLPLLPDWTYESGDIFGDNLSRMYYQTINQFQRYCYHVLKNLGGVYCDFKSVNEAGAIYSDEPKEKQVAALDFLDRHILQKPEWIIAPSYVSRFLPNPENYIERLGSTVVNNLASPGLLSRLTSTYPVSEYLPSLTSRLFKGAATSDAYKQKLQQTYVAALVSNFDNARADNVRAIVLQQLKRIRQYCQAYASQPHYASLVDYIDRSLTIK